MKKEFFISDLISKAQEEFKTNGARCCDSCKKSARSDSVQTAIKWAYERALKDYLASEQGEKE